MYLLLVLLTGCGLKEMLPEGPAMTAWERTQRFGEDRPSGVVYTDMPRVDHPVLPLSVWGAMYDVDIALRSKHPEWNMHEYAMIRTPEGPLWVAKDARESTMTQSIVADLPGIDGWMPEIPVQRKSGRMEVVDHSTGERLDLAFAYDNIDGQPVEVTYTGKPPVTRMKKRNGSTMGHSASQLYVALDVSHRTFGKRATVTIDGERQKLVRLLGLVPFDMVLRQAQGGLASGDLFQETGDRLLAEPSGGAVGSAEAFDTGEAWIEATPARFAVTYASPFGGETVTWWDITDHEEWVDTTQTSELRTLHYRFRRDGDALELQSMHVTQWGQGARIVNIQLSPPLPDLRRKFEGHHTSDFVVDIDGQQNHAYGTLETWWDGDSPHVQLHPAAPWWTLDRPMHTTITYEPDGTRTRIQMGSGR